MANVIKHKRGSGSDPVASDLVVGEVAIRTDVGKLFTKMDNGSVAEIAGGGSDIAINTLSSSSATGGGSATFNGSAYRFTLSAPPNVSAAQLLVSINGVIQKPVPGTGQPSEGFSVDGTDIILGDAPATGSDFFILTFKSLGVSEPADNSVTSAKIVDGAIVNADINASAAIAGTKISPDFGSQNIVTTGTISSTNGTGLKVNNTNGSIFFGTGTSAYASSAGIGVAGGDNFHMSGSNADDLCIGAKTGKRIVFGTRVDAGVIIRRLTIASDGTTTVHNNLDVGAGIDVTGAITGTGDLTIDTNTLHVDSSNNRVGIGTTNPNHMLDISGSNPILALNDTDTTNDRFRLTYNGGSTQLQVDPNNVRSGSHLLVAVDGSERMRIDSSGNVGIGTTSPDHLLHIQNNSVTTTKITVESTGTDSYPAFRVKNDARSYDLGINGATDSFRIFDVTANSQRLTLDSTGRFGINAAGTKGMLEVRASGGAADQLTALFGANEGTTAGTLSNNADKACRIGIQHYQTAEEPYALLVGSAGSSSNSLSFGGSTSLMNAATLIRFYTAADTTTVTGTERMRIDSSGNVSIGASSYGGGGSSPKFYISTTSDRAVKIHNTNSATSSVQITNAATGQGDDNGMQLAALGNGECLIANAEAERIIIMSQEANNNTPVVNFNKPQGPSNAQTTMIAFETGNQGRGAVLSSSSDGGSPSFSSVSDYRIKTNIRDYTNGYDNIKAIPVKLFDMISDGTKDIKGWIAHEVQAFIPEAVMGVKDAVDSDENPILQQLSYGLFMPDVVGALQTAIAKIETLEAKVEALEAK